MLSLEPTRRAVRRVPFITGLGVVVLVLGGLADLAAHLGSAAHPALFDGHAPAETTAHLVVFMGMVLILLGVVLDGVRQTRAHRNR